MKPKIEEIKDMITEFSDRKIGKGRSFKSPLPHLLEEVVEVADSDGDIMEYADCLLLLLDSFRMKYPELEANDLLIACEEKLKICETRKWAEPDENGIIHHIKEK